MNTKPNLQLQLLLELFLCQFKVWIYLISFHLFPAIFLLNQTSLYKCIHHGNLPCVNCYCTCNIPDIKNDFSPILQNEKHSIRTYSVKHRAHEAHEHNCNPARCADKTDAACPSTPCIVQSMCAERQPCAGLPPLTHV